MSKVEYASDGRPRPPWQARREEREQAQVELSAVILQQAQSLGGILDFMRAPPINDVMYAGARTIPATGFDYLEFPAAYSAITIANVSNSLLTFGKAGAASAPPPAGAGITRIPAGFFRTFAARGNGFTVFGLPGSSYDITVYQRPRPAASGSCGQANGAVLIAAGTTASASATVTSDDMEHMAAVLNVSAVSGGEAVTLAINGVTPSGYVYPLLQGLAVTAVGVTPYRVGVGLTPSANAVANDLVPSIVQVVATISGAGAITYGVDLVSG